MFGAGRPSAVLLGADGLLAGGPVAGARAVGEFVEDILAELEGAPLPEQVEPDDDRRRRDDHDRHRPRSRRPRSRGRGVRVTRALLLSEHDLAGWQRRFAAGEVPSALPYGVDVLATIGYQLRGAPQSTGAFGTKLRDVVEHRTGLAVERTLRGAGAARSTDVVLALLERQGMLAGLWKRAGLPPYAATPLVIWSCWLADDIRRADADGRARLLRRIEAADLITHLSRHETEIFVDLGIPTERLFPVTYGVSHRYYVPPETRTSRATSRSWPSARTAAATTPRWSTPCAAPTWSSTWSASRTTSPASTSPPTSGCTRRSTCRSTGPCCSRAQVVAVPTLDLAYPTGSSVALESASTGCCVVVTGTRSMRDLLHRRRQRPRGRGGRRRRLARRAPRAARRPAAARPVGGRRPALGRAAVQRRPHVDRGGRGDGRAWPGRSMTPTRRRLRALVGGARRRLRLRASRLANPFLEPREHRVNTAWRTAVLDGGVDITAAVDAPTWWCPPSRRRPSDAAR